MLCLWMLCALMAVTADECRRDARRDAPRVSRYSADRTHTICQRAPEWRVEDSTVGVRMYKRCPRLEALRERRTRRCCVNTRQRQGSGHARPRV